MHPKRVLVASLLVALLLTACGGDGGGSSTSCDLDYWDGSVGTCLPKGWNIVERETLRQRGVPEETLVAFQAETAVSGQFPTVSVTREQLKTEIEAVAYSNASIRSVEVLPGYELLDQKDVTIDGEKVSLHMFTAQPVDGEPRRRFYQVSTVAGDSGYTFTGTAPVSVDRSIEEQILTILENATLKGKQEEEEE